MSGGEVIEGFLCPLCMKDLGDVIQLQVSNIINYWNPAYTSIRSTKGTKWRNIFNLYNSLLMSAPTIPYWFSGSFWWSTFQRRPSICPDIQRAFWQSQADPCGWPRHWGRGSGEWFWLILVNNPNTRLLLVNSQGLQEPVARLRLAPSEDDDSHPVSGIR